MPMRRKNQPASITLAHINDTHSYFEPTSLQLTLEHDADILKPFVSAGGFARIATRIAQLRDDAQRMQREFLFYMRETVSKEHSTFRCSKVKRMPTCSMHSS